MPDPQIESLGAAFHEFKTANEKALEARSAGEKARHDELIESQKKMNARMDEIETIVSRPLLVKTGEPTEEERKVRALESRAFNTLVRKGHQFLTPEEARALATDNATSGGYLMPRNINDSVLELLVEMSPMRQVADVVTITQGDTDEQPKEGTTAFATGWEGERETGAVTATGTFEMDKVPTHFQYAKPLVTAKMIEDSAFDIEAYVSKKVAQRLGLAEGTAFINGNGISKPLGLVSTHPGSTAITEVASGVSGSLDTDSMLLLMAALAEFYAGQASFLMRRATKFIVRRLKAGDGHYLWQPSLQIGTPPSFDGHAVLEAPDVAAVAANAKAVIFGDFKKAYRIVDRRGIVVKPDPFTAKPHVEMYTTRRVGGQVVLPEAVKILTCDA